MTDAPGLPYAVSLLPASSLTNHTGAWRTQRPAYVDLVPPCSAACPAGEDSSRRYTKVIEDTSGVSAANSR